MAQQIVWAKQTVEGRQITNDGSELIDFFYVPSETPDGKSPGILYSVPEYDTAARNAISLGTAPAGGGSEGVQGLIAVDSPVYGNKLFGIAYQNCFFEYGGTNLNNTAVIPTSDIHLFTSDSNEFFTDGCARLASDGRRICFIRGRSVAMWDQEANSQAGGFVSVYAPVATNPQELLDDEDWVDIVWINGYFVLLAKTGEIFHSQLHSADFDQLDFATAERNPDPGVGLAVFQGRLYVFGTQSIEVYRDAGTTPFAFQRIHDSAIPFGCIARNTIQVNEGGVFFLAHDKSLYVTNGQAPQKLSNATVEYDIARAVLTQSYGMVYTEEGRRFYGLGLWISGTRWKYWVIDLVSSLWHERSLLPECIARYRGENRVGFYNAGYIYPYHMDAVRRSGAGDRTAVASLIHNNRKALSFQSLFIDVPVLGDSRSGTLYLDWSDDGKKTWSTAREHSLSNGRLRSNLLGSTVDGRNFRIRTNSPDRVQIEATYINATPMEGYGL